MLFAHPCKRRVCSKRRSHADSKHEWLVRFICLEIERDDVEYQIQKTVDTIGSLLRQPVAFTGEINGSSSHAKDCGSSSNILLPAHILDAELWDTLQIEANSLEASVQSTMNSIQRDGLIERSFVKENLSWLEVKYPLVPLVDRQTLREEILSCFEGGSRQDIKEADRAIARAEVVLKKAQETALSNWDSALAAVREELSRREVVEELQQRREVRDLERVLEAAAEAVKAEAVKEQEQALERQRQAQHEQSRTQVAEYRRQMAEEAAQAEAAAARAAAARAQEEHERCNFNRDRSSFRSGLVVARQAQREAQRREADRRARLHAQHLDRLRSEVLYPGPLLVGWAAFLVPHAPDMGCRS
eukprot:jgi/Botrbrau1/3418/Bobra.0337s0051.1